MTTQILLLPSGNNSDSWPELLMETVSAWNLEHSIRTRNVALKGILNKYYNRMWRNTKRNYLRSILSGLEMIHISWINLHKNIYLNPIHLVPIEFFWRRNIYICTTFSSKTLYFLRQEASTGTRNIALKRNIGRHKANITFCRGAQNNAEVSDKFKSKRFLKKVKSKSEYFHTTQKTLKNEYDVCDSSRHH